MVKSSLSPEAILSELTCLPGKSNYYIAYSGGLDSTVLLHLFSLIKQTEKINLTAIHVNHGISHNADKWQKHCTDICHEFGVTLISEKISIESNNGEGLEARARELRYKTLKKHLLPGDVLVTAHHQDDLIETMIFNLLRGSGPAGLSGIPRSRRFNNSWIIRPMLGFSRRDIEQYAKDKNLIWVDDESNDQTTQDRNYIRHNVLPVILNRWPSANKTLARVARHQSELASLLENIASDDLSGITDSKDNSLDCLKLTIYDRPRIKNMLRFWIKNNNFDMPSEIILESILNEVIYASKDSQPHLKWRDTEIRRYKNRLYIMKSVNETDFTVNYRWDLKVPLEINHRLLKAESVKGRGLRQSLIGKNGVEVRFRQGGEKIKPIGRNETHDLKKLLQEVEVPPWIRTTIPLIYLDGQLAVVVGYWVEASCSASGNESGWDITYGQPCFQETRNENI